MGLSACVEWGHGTGMKNSAFPATVQALASGPARVAPVKLCQLTSKQGHPFEQKAQQAWRDGPASQNENEHETQTPLLAAARCAEGPGRARGPAVPSAGL